eukprot:jgi/Chrzof1/13594/Cz08g03170.t1
MGEMGCGFLQSNRTKGRLSEFASQLFTCIPTWTHCSEQQLESVYTGSMAHKIPAIAAHIAAVNSWLAALEAEDGPPTKYRPQRKQALEDLKTALQQRLAFLEQNHIIPLQHGGTMADDISAVRAEVAKVTRKLADMEAACSKDPTNQVLPQIVLALQRQKAALQEKEVILMRRAGGCRC